MRLPIVTRHGGSVAKTPSHDQPPVPALRQRRLDQFRRHLAAADPMFVAPERPRDLALARRLLAMSTHYETLMDEARRDRALQWVGHTDRPLRALQCVACHNFTWLLKC